MRFIEELADLCLCLGRHKQYGDLFWYLKCSPLKSHKAYMKCFGAAVEWEGSARY